MKEIRAVLRKHDLAALVIIGSPTHTQFLIEPETSWSVAKFEQLPDGTTGMRIRAKHNDPPERREKLRLTTGLVLGWIAGIDEVQKALQWMAMELGKKIGIEHVDRNDSKELPPIDPFRYD